MPRLNIEDDAQRALETLEAGGTAMLPHYCGYGMFGATEEAVQRIFRTKRRGDHKRNTMICDMEGQREIHVLDQRRQDMIEMIAVDYDLPLAAIAPYRSDHPLLSGLSETTLAGSTARGNIAIFCNAGPVPNALGRLSREAGLAVFGSSANLSGSGQRFRVEDVQPEVREIADLVVDHGLARYHPYKRSATIINFATMEVVRIGACYEQQADILKRHFDWELPADPGLEENASGHLMEFALRDDPV